MRYSRLTSFVFVAEVALLALGSACGTQDSTGSMDDPQVESVSVALTTVPTGALCIRITATPSSGAATVKTFSVTSGSSSASLQLGPLSPGNYTFIADAFNLACTSLTGAGNWIADPTPVALKAGATTTITMTFRENNPVTVTANFVPNIQSISLFGNTFVVTDQGVLQSGLISSSQTFVRTNFSVFNASSVPGNAVAALAAAANGACAVRVDGTVWCWGTNRNGQLGPGIAEGATATTPVQVTGLSAAKLVAAGNGHTCVSATGGSGTGVYCWGFNYYGQVGNGTGSGTPIVTTPVLVLSSGVRSLTAGEYDTFAITNQGYLYAWGNGTSGQLGNGIAGNQLAPTLIARSMVTQGVAAGFTHTCFLGGDGSVACVGDNSSGQLGDGTTTTRTTSAIISGLTAIQVVAGGYFTCALTSTGQPQCWGNNQTGQVGDGTGILRSTPTTVGGGKYAFASLSSGPSSVCGITASFDLYCWGDDGYGGLGDGTVNTAFAPVKVQLQ